MLDDIGADAIKTGMLGDAAVVEAVAELLDGRAGIPAVIDPVMVAKGGAPPAGADEALDGPARAAGPARRAADPQRAGGRRP